MAAVTEKQHVAKRRRKTSSFVPINKSARFNSGFMSQFSQKPVRSRKKRHFSLHEFISKIKPRPSRSRDNFRPERIKVRKKGSGFSFPVPSLATIAVVAGTVVIGLAAINWEGMDFEVPDSYAFQPAVNSEAEEHTFRYAATGVTNILPANVVIPQEQAPAAETQIEAVIEETPVPSGQNDLITFEWQQYRVKRGDSVSAIAQRHGVSVGAIIASNEIRNARTLQEGALLRIPNIDGIPYQIKNGDSLSKISASFNVPLEVILDVNDIKNDNIKAGETIFIPGARMNDIDLRLSLGELFMYPVRSRHVTSPYGMRKDPISGALNFHTGIDLRADTGTPVVAALDGTVSVVSENWLYGKYIIITHDNGYKTLYAHLNSYSVKRGDRVARGRKIAESGNTGYSTGPHLHFSIYDKNNKLINPLELLR